MTRIFSFLLTMVASTFFFHPSLHAQESFYKGKIVRIVVGASAGGGYDTYSRTLARHMGKHIPGEPAFVVENMPGAGFLISANYMFKVAKPDGLTMGHFTGGLFLQQLIEKPGIEFDARKFAYVGVPTQDNNVIGISKRSGVKSMEDWLASKTLLKLGGVGAGSATDDVVKVLIATIGLPAQLVTGYKGTAEIRLAFNSGELQGTSSSWESFKATWRQELDSGDLMIVLQNIAQPHPDLGKVPLAISLAKTDEARKLIRALVHSYGATARPYVLAPGTPKDRIQTLQKAFMDTVKDPEFLADAKKAKLDVNPLSGAELERNVQEVFGLDPSLVLKTKEIFR
jgi:tripartite-type tricarboxylate transporter receptor subunit TctC